MGISENIEKSSKKSVKMDMGSRKSKLEIDERLPQRVLYTSLVSAGLILMISLSQWSGEVTLGLAIGMGISIVFFLTLSKSVKSFLTIEKNRRMPFFVVIAILKFVVLCIALFFIFKYLSVSYPALLIGIGLAQTIIFLKIIGIGMVNYMNRSYSPLSLSKCDSLKG